MSVDLPTPEWPTSTLTRPARAARTASTPSAAVPSCDGSPAAVPSHDGSPAASSALTAWLAGRTEVATERTPRGS